MNCNICLTEGLKKKNIKFLDCKHYICKECFKKLIRNKCPYCRADIPDKEDGVYPVQDIDFNVNDFHQENIYETNIINYTDYLINYDYYNYLYNYYILKRNKRQRRKKLMEKKEEKKNRNKRKKRIKRIKKEKIIINDEEIITMTYNNYLLWNKNTFFKKNKKKKKINL